MTDEAIPRRPCARTFTLEDLHVRSDGGGRVVEAYAAVWRDASGKQITAEIRDQDGHYNETLTPTAFNRTIQHRGLNFGVLFNHGMTIDGSPNPNGTMPVGVPLDVHADDRGVFTATRYLDNPLADHGRWMRSSRARSARSPIRGCSASRPRRTRRVAPHCR
jgi:phage head maturation protease